MDGWEISRLVWVDKASNAPQQAPVAAPEVTDKKADKADAPAKGPTEAQPAEVKHDQVAVAGQQTAEVQAQGEKEVAQAREVVDARSTGATGAAGAKATAPTETAETLDGEAELYEFIKKLMYSTDIMNTEDSEERNRIIQEAAHDVDIKKLEMQLQKSFFTVTVKEENDFKSKYYSGGKLDASKFRAAIDSRIFKPRELLVFMAVTTPADCDKSTEQTPEFIAIQPLWGKIERHQEMLKSKRNLNKITDTLNQYKDTKECKQSYDKLMESYKKGEEPSDADKKAFVDSISNAGDKKLIEDALNTNENHDMESQIVRLLKFDNKDFTKEDVAKLTESGKLNFREAQIALNILRSGSVPEAKKTDIWESLEKLITMLTALANKFIASLDKELNKNKPKTFEKSPWGTGDKKYAFENGYEKGKRDGWVTFEQMTEGTSIYAMESGTIKVEPQTPTQEGQQTVSIISGSGAEIQYRGLDPEKFTAGAKINAGDKIGKTRENTGLKLRVLDSKKDPVDPTELLAPYIKTEAK